jgi:selenocysteine lyase/cysteine desulfurase
MLLAKEKLLSLKRVKVYLPNDNRGSILLFNVEGMPCKEVGEYLDRQKICVRSGMHCSPLAHRRVGSYNSGGVRASFGAFSQKDDAERLYEALKVLAR